MQCDDENSTLYFIINRTYITISKLYLLHLHYISARFASVIFLNVPVQPADMFHAAFSLLNATRWPIVTVVQAVIPNNQRELYTCRVESLVKSSQ